jgi:hypothetical protein
MKKKSEIAICSCLVSLLYVCPAAHGWTNKAHIYVNRIAAQRIPSSMPLFMRQAVNEIAYLGPEPDRWRSPTEWALKVSQEPDHFIKLELVSWLNPLPRDRYQFCRRLYEKRAGTTQQPDEYLPEKIGLQPYIVAEIYGRLEAGFREYRKLHARHKAIPSLQRPIIFYSGWLGHYVADGSQPLHTSIQINGWTGPNPRGYTIQRSVHALFETSYVDNCIRGGDFSALIHAPQKLTDPFVNYVNYLRHSNELVENVYMIQKSGGFAGKGSREAYEFTTERLASASQMLLNLWYTAWITSAEPQQPQLDFRAPE